jgi:hypothetical protein
MGKIGQFPTPAVPKASQFSLIRREVRLLAEKPIPKTKAGAVASRRIAPAI